MASGNTGPTTVTWSPAARVTVCAVPYPATWYSSTYTRRNNSTCVQPKHLDPRPVTIGPFWISMLDQPLGTVSASCSHAARNVSPTNSNRLLPVDPPRHANNAGRPASGTDPRPRRHPTYRRAAESMVAITAKLGVAGVLLTAELGVAAALMMPRCGGPVDDRAAV